ncbi:hypothetical protein C900_01319 [Fulvivirga imtechensis AK7]|uniref:Uncharacterized protein n=1 Tax=Fulvivirga imtechensis AK7 TaxID=1237149 RepID=L8JU50_9BACT|nr:hypothetical protein C900_01319 [Fulvivirga imtechensis AK7]
MLPFYRLKKEEPARLEGTANIIESRHTSEQLTKFIIASRRFQISAALLPE